MKMKDAMVRAPGQRKVHHGLRVSCIYCSAVALIYSSPPNAAPKTPLLPLYVSWACSPLSGLPLRQVDTSLVNKRHHFISRSLAVQELDSPDNFLAALVHIEPEDVVAGVLPLVRWNAVVLDMVLESGLPGDVGDDCVAALALYDLVDLERVSLDDGLHAGDHADEALLVEGADALRADFLDGGRCDLVRVVLCENWLDDGFVHRCSVADPSSGGLHSL